MKALMVAGPVTKAATSHTPNVLPNQELQIKGALQQRDAYPTVTVCIIHGKEQSANSKYSQ
jgi:hypothetical protein